MAYISGGRHETLHHHPHPALEPTGNPSGSCTRPPVPEGRQCISTGKLGAQVPVSAGPFWRLRSWPRELTDSPWSQRQRWEWWCSALLHAQPPGTALRVPRTPQEHSSSPNQEWTGVANSGGQGHLKVRDERSAWIFWDTCHHQLTKCEHTAVKEKLASPPNG